MRMSSGKKLKNMEKKILIKKYENRRLYDVTHSRYVNLDEVARAVQDGYDVQVVDASTGEDLTRLVMTQIITESAKTSDSVFPLDILREMVVASRFAPGHRLRIEIAGTNFPEYERNLNTGGPSFNETRAVVAHDYIYHDRGHRSFFELPVVHAPR